MARGVLAVPPKVPQFDKSHSVLHVGNILDMERIQSLFDTVPLDGYVQGGFRRKSICRVKVGRGGLRLAEHGPLYQPAEYNPVHGGLTRDYPEMELELLGLLAPLIQVFAACAALSEEHEILVQAQRVTATSGEDGATGFPVVEGWHQDNTRVLAIFAVNRVNVDGGISLLAHDREGRRVALKRVLELGELLLIDDTTMWHNTTAITKESSADQAFRDVVILTWPSCRAAQRAHEKKRHSTAAHLPTGFGSPSPVA